MLAQYSTDHPPTLIGVKAAMVGTNGIKPDVWYTLNEAGEFVDVKEWGLA